MSPANTTSFRRIAIIGTGLIGGSFALSLRALSLRKQFPSLSLVGYGHPGSAAAALARGVVEETAPDIPSAVRGADLIYVALPIGATIEALATIAKAAEPHALVTDAGSTKVSICRAAQEHFAGGAHSQSSARFLGGHPMAGKECSGVENADAELFHGSPYVLVAPESDADLRVKEFAEIIRAIGAQPIWSDAETHDWAVGIVSHLPQLVSIALARVVQDETDETGLPLSMAGQGLQDMLRLAGSPYGMWRDIFLTNTENTARALDRLAQAIDHLRTHLASKDLEQEFRTANELYALLQKLR